MELQAVIYFREANCQHIKQKLIDRAIEMGLKGNATMLIFCLKNYCKWSDRAPIPEPEFEAPEWFDPDDPEGN